MTDVFISYAREDCDVAQNIAKALASGECSVWWDRALIGGENFDEVIERELDQAKSVIVLWSRHSTSSNWVKSEASVAEERGVLVPVFIEQVRLPLEFRRKHTIDLSAWDGDPGAPAFNPVRRAIAVHLHPGNPPGAFTTEGKANKPAGFTDLAIKERRSLAMFFVQPVMIFIFGSAALAVVSLLLYRYEHVKARPNAGTTSAEVKRPPTSIAPLPTGSPQNASKSDAPKAGPPSNSTALGSRAGTRHSPKEPIVEASISNSEVSETKKRDLRTQKAADIYGASQKVEADLNRVTTDLENLLKARVQSLDPVREHSLQDKFHADYDIFDQDGWQWWNRIIFESELAEILDSNSIAEARVLAKKYDDNLKQTTINLNPLWTKMERSPQLESPDELRSLLNKIYVANKGNAECRSQFVNAFIAFFRNLPPQEASVPICPVQIAPR